MPDGGSTPKGLTTSLTGWIPGSSLTAYGLVEKKQICAWTPGCKEIAPSTALRKWYQYDPKCWPAFCMRCKAELKNPELQKAIADTLQAARKHSAITLSYAAKDAKHNEAVVLRTIFKRRAR